MSNSKKAFIEQQVVVTGSACPLGATLTIPDAGQKSPAILIIPGTGTSDRDGNNERFDLRLYKELAQFLGGLGFVVLRYDKRGIGASGGDYYQTGFRDLVDDAQACVEFLRDRPEVDADQLTLLGHSEGCWIAPAVNARTHVQGLILLAGACESARETLPRQTAMALEALEQLQGFRGELIGGDSEWHIIRDMTHILRRTDENATILSLMKLYKKLSSEPIDAELLRVIEDWLQKHFGHGEVELVL